MQYDVIYSCETLFYYRFNQNLCMKNFNCERKNTYLEKSMNLTDIIIISIFQVYLISKIAYLLYIFHDILEFSIVIQQFF